MSDLPEKTSPSGTPDRDWDPNAALARVACGDVAGFTARLHAAAEAYARDSHWEHKYVRSRDRCRNLETIVSKLEARLKAIAKAEPMEGEPIWHFLDRVQKIASQASG